MAVKYLVAAMVACTVELLLWFVSLIVVYLNLLVMGYEISLLQIDMCVIYILLYLK